MKMMCIISMMLVMIVIGSFVVSNEIEVINSYFNNMNNVIEMIK